MRDDTVAAYMRGSHVVMGLLALACSSSVTGGRGERLGCAKDTDCKGNRICSAGQCVAPDDGGGTGGSNAAGGSGGSNRSGGATSTEPHVDAGNGGSTGRDTGGASAGGGSVIGSSGRVGAETDGGADAGRNGAESVCDGVKYMAPPVPVDLYIMVDQSSSMADPVPGSSPLMTWWQEAQQGLTSFVNSPRAKGAQAGLPAATVGIQFFPLDGVAPQSCMASYATPEVELAPLPGNTAPIVAAIQKHQPTAFTPTAPALTGAIAHMKAWAPNHPGHAPVVVFVTDGFPTECDPQDIIEIATIAQKAYQTDPKVRTFVVGFNLGPGGSNLDAIAQEGGTGKARLINGGDIGSQFADALLDISNTTLQCKFDPPLPPAGVAFDPSRVAVTYTPSATMVETQIPKLGGLSDCDLNMGNGWFYDSPTKPAQILTCPATCAKFSAGVVKTAYGCAPVSGVPR